MDVEPSVAMDANLPSDSVSVTDVPMAVDGQGSDAPISLDYSNECGDPGCLAHPAGMLGGEVVCPPRSYGLARLGHGSGEWTFGFLARRGCGGLGLQVGPVPSGEGRLGMRAEAYGGDGSDMVGGLAVEFMPEGEGVFLEAVLEGVFSAAFGGEPGICHGAPRSFQVHQDAANEQWRITFDRIWTSIQACEAGAPAVEGPFVACVSWRSGCSLPGDGAIGPDR